MTGVGPTGGRTAGVAVTVEGIGHALVVELTASASIGGWYGCSIGGSIGAVFRVFRVGWFGNLSALPEKAEMPRLEGLEAVEEKVGVSSFLLLSLCFRCLAFSSSMRL